MPSTLPQPNATRQGQTSSPARTVGPGRRLTGVSRSSTLAAGLLARLDFAQGSPSVLVPTVECGLISTSGR
jgi:hypothetical protein